jgi:hypothetical protein
MNEINFAGPEIAASRERGITVNEGELWKILRLEAERAAAGEEIANGAASCPVFALMRTTLRTSDEEFVPDSPLEGDGFELTVPHGERPLGRAMWFPRTASTLITTRGAVGRWRGWQPASKGLDDDHATTAAGARVRERLRRIGVARRLGRRRDRCRRRSLEE